MRRVPDSAVDCACVPYPSLCAAFPTLQGGTCTRGVSWWPLHWTSTWPWSTATKVRASALDMFWGCCPMTLG